MRPATHDARDDIAFPALRSAGQLGLALATVGALTGALLCEVAPSRPILGLGLAALGAFLAVVSGVMLLVARLEPRVGSERPAPPVLARIPRPRTHRRLTRVRTSSLVRPCTG